MDSKKTKNFGVTVSKRGHRTVWARGAWGLTIRYCEPGEAREHLKALKALKALENDGNANAILEYMKNHCR